MALGTRSATFFEGRWHDGDAPILGASDHGAWQGTMVFDGARFFEGVTPDLDRHCARLIASATAMGLAAPVGAAEIEALLHEGVRRMGSDRALYLRPMMWSRQGSPAIIDALPDSTAFAVCIEDLPLRGRAPFALGVSPYRRPGPDCAITEAKAACHYPNNARILREARARGFDNALSLDAEGKVAETASTNVFLVRDGVVMTPVPNGTFLDGITRQRIIALLRAEGISVVEASLDVTDFAAAEEIFLTGNANKVVPVTRFEQRELHSTRIAERALALYRDFAHAGRRAA
ncbi:MAG: branched-chain amino acid aminotransferase [Rhodobacteraceae bacterium]|uniref:branched-chain amino acid aminotransferase n=1 Tax=Amaricoccus sp. TaxID=1872485 RepID=UPI001D90F187|nr:branched-chain amino acid aminotransferase [Amaricoccus sp.]MCB1370952.1 branched-chain amino acid aminotransferase [Paracoccaceae bacterium]MCC0065919.1 branched-chain amino acid aminotransferase [Rhodovulum sp.]MCB1372928.1 branched-chain amino acid aminotransferase [Paracoccaceae bacterium]MCB1403599.1 branched-chain amino acid aminotransferase [Paracoccaceae bacterium]HRW15804.1 branched-chain amino acid aminotransferase [Amaricoccus sp.]